MSDDIIGGVSAPIQEYMYFKEKMALPNTLMTGVSGMRAAGEEYLPREPKESKEAYKVRLQRSNLYNVYRKTITSSSGQALMNPLVISNVPEELKFLEDNCTGDGRSITEVADEMIQHHLHFGKSHLLVDFPTNASKPMNYVEFKRSGFRPYFNLINPMSLIGWDYNLDMGYPRLDNIRVVEVDRVRDEENPWLSLDRKLIRVWYPNYVELYKHDLDDNQFSGEPETYPNTLGIIPLVTGYANKTGFMTSLPPLEDLAEVNLTHWQSSSDQRNILHIARVPFIFASGFAEGELQGAEIGSNRIITTSSENADMKYVEHTGAAIDAGKTDLDDLENQMRILGAELIMGKSKDRQTATARQIDQLESLSLMQLTIRSTLRMIKDAYILAGLWLGVDASDVEVSIGATTPAEPNPTNALVGMKDLPLTDKQLFEEAKRRGIIAPSVEYDPEGVKKEREAKREAEAPPVEENDEQTNNNGDQDQLEGDSSTEEISEE